MKWNIEMNEAKSTRNSFQLGVHIRVGRIGESTKYVLAKR